MPLGGHNIVSEIGLSICRGPYGGGVVEGSSTEGFSLELPLVFWFGITSYVFDLVERTTVSLHIST